ncbi:hypothetical protein [Candidatus Harpocratesius sp.]
MKRGRKKGGKNRPKHIIELEKKKKRENPKPKGRPPGKSNKKEWEVHVFDHDKKRGWITALGGSSSVVVATMYKILKQFRDIHITSNLVEKEFSALKKLIDFRGRRSIEMWKDLLLSYFIIRDDPKILEKILINVEISYQMVSKAMPTLVSCQVSS